MKTNKEVPSSSGSLDGGWVSSRRAAWMTFQRLRGNSALEQPHRTCPPRPTSPVRTARTWPECRPAGMSTMDHYSRHDWLVPSKLPPLNPKQGILSIKNEPASNKKDSARAWAQHRAGWTNAWKRYDEQHNQTPEKGDVSIMPVVNLKRQVVVLSEKDAATLKRVKGIYANSSYKTFREEKIKDTLRSLHLKSLNHEIKASLKEHKKKSEKDKQTREELKRIRNKFDKEKRRREQRSYIRLSVLDAPQVSRKLFGLPDEGQELSRVSSATKAEKKIREIWRRNMKRAALIETFINFKAKEKDDFPQIRIKETGILTEVERNKQNEKIERIVESPPKTLEKDKLQVNFIKNEIDILSSVDLDEDEDRLFEFSD